MAQSVISLWPSELDALTPIRTPTTILQEQAAEFNRRMKNIISASVLPKLGFEGFGNSFVLQAPALGSYRYELLSIDYPFTLYPVTITHDQQFIKCSSEETFHEELKKIFANPKTVELIRAFLSQVSAKTVAVN